MNTTQHATHTPGPWLLETEPYNGYRVISDPGGDQVIEWEIGNTIPSEADARLIAVAPELLKECQSLLAMVEEMLPKYGPCQWGDIEVEYARVLIAKATGAAQ